MVSRGNSQRMGKQAHGSPVEEAGLETATEGDRVAAAMLALPERLQSVLWYTEILGMTPEEIAPLLGICARTVSEELVRARKDLRLAFQQTDQGRRSMSPGPRAILPAPTDALSP